MSEFAKALSHPAKIVILRTLAESTCHCGELVQNLPLAQSTVSKHLADLKDVGLVIGEDAGARTYYRINRERYQELSIAMREVLDSINNTNLMRGDDNE